MPLHAIVFGVERLFTNGTPRIIVQFGEQAVGIGAGLFLRFAHDDMGAIAEFQRPAKACGAGGEVGDILPHFVHCVGPHQIHVAPFGGAFAGLMGQAAEVKGGAFAGNRRNTRRVEFQIIKLPLMVDGFAVQQRANDFHHLGRTGIARAALDLLTRHVGGDDIDVEPPAGPLRIGAKNTVERCDPPRQLRRPILPNAGGPKQLHPLNLRRHGGGEGGGV